VLDELLLVLLPLLLLPLLLPPRNALLLLEPPLLALPVDEGFMIWVRVFCAICRLRAAVITSSPAATTL
jgi:hypothetical protein